MIEWPLERAMHWVISARQRRVSTSGASWRRLMLSWERSVNLKALWLNSQPECSRLKSSKVLCVTTLGIGSFKLIQIKIRRSLRIPSSLKQHLACSAEVGTRARRCWSTRCQRKSTSLSQTLSGWSRWPRAAQVSPATRASRLTG